MHDPQPWRLSEPPADELVRRFMRRFEGYDQAYGTYNADVAAKEHDPGKPKVEIKSTARLEKKPVTFALGRMHLQGVSSLGTIPIRLDNLCIWGTIDIDDYKVDVVELMRRITEGGFPLITCGSKSGGLHLFHFMAEPIPAIQMQFRLSQMAAYLGLGGCEVFPKQGVVNYSGGDYGSWLNLPYFGATRWAYKPNGTVMPLDEFLDLADRLEQSAASFQSEAAHDNSDYDSGPNRAYATGTGSADLTDGPPCLEHLSSLGFKEGARNTSLFNMATFAKKKYGDDWERIVKGWNRDLFNPPLSDKEINSAINSQRKKDYFYQCQHKPLVTHCNSALCRLRPYGVSTDKPPERLDTAYIAEFRTTSVRWLWPGKIARGKITMLSGFPKLGKSIIAADIAARMSTGGLIPLGNGARFPKGKVLYLCAEDDHYDTLVPRLRAMGADPYGVKVVKSVVSDKNKRRVDLTKDTEMLRYEMTQEKEMTGVGFAMVVFDPISAYEGAASEGRANTNPAVRNFTGPIEDLGHDFDAAIFFVNHQRKDHTGPAIYSILHSVAWVAVPRFILVGGKHYEYVVDEQGNKVKTPTGLRLIAVAGANNAPDGADLTMAYEIVGMRVTMDDGTEDNLGVIRWDSEMDIPADDVTSGRGGIGGEPEGKIKAVDKAEAFIRWRLRDGPMLRDVVYDDASRQQHISEASMKRAATRMAKNHELFMEKQKGIPDGPSWWSLTEEIQWELVLNVPF